MHCIQLLLSSDHLIRKNHAFKGKKGRNFSKSNRVGSPLLGQTNWDVGHSLASCSHVTTNNNKQQTVPLLITIILIYLKSYTRHILHMNVLFADPHVL